MLKKHAAWSRNRRGEGKIIDLRRIVPQPWDKEEYETQPVDLAVFRDVSPFIRVSRNETDPGK